MQDGPFLSEAHLSGSGEQATPPPSAVLFSSAHSGASISFNATQLSLVAAYFEGKFKPGFEKFIEVVEDHEMKSLRAYLIVCALSLAPEFYEPLFNFYYPPVEETSTFYPQNSYFRELVLNFNKLCLGKISVDNEIYSQIFDPRLSSQSSTTNSPTKKILLSRAIAIELRSFVQDFDFNNEFIQKAQIFLSNMGINETSDIAKGFGQSTVRRKLSF